MMARAIAAAAAPSREVGTTFAGEIETDDLRVDLGPARDRLFLRKPRPRYDGCAQRMAPQASGRQALLRDCYFNSAAREPCIFA
jgi:hypothetical protein